MHWISALSTTPDRQRRVGGFQDNSPIPELSFSVEWMDYNQGGVFEKNASTFIKILLVILPINKRNKIHE